ncbi:MAG: endospore germination permease [Firmicutes bacterium]|nr:endospore germination permease [Bacillota bacterium]
MAGLEKGKINSKQLFTLLVLTRLIAILLDAPTFSATSIGHDAWIAAVISTSMVLVWACFLVHIGGKFPGMTIIEYSQLVLGPWLGRLAGFLIILFFIQESARAVSVCGAAYVTAVMPETPLLVFVLMITFLSANAVRGGLEVLARAGTIVFGVTIILLTALLILPLNKMDFNYLRPMLAEGWRELQKASLLSFTMYTDYLIITMLLPYLENQKSAARTVAYATLVSGVFIAVLSIVVVVTFGPLISYVNLPAFSLGRLVDFALIIERLEIIPLIAFTVGTGVKQALLLWGVVLGLAQIFNLKEMQALAYPVGLLIVAFSLWIFHGALDKLNFISLRSFGILSILMGVVIPLLIYIVGWIRGSFASAAKKGADRD